MYMNPHIFFLANAPGLIIWDYKNHKQYELDEAHSIRLLQLIATPNLLNISSAIDLAFVENKIFSAETFDDSYWGWDVLSKIFHLGTKDIPQTAVPKNAEEWARLYHDHCREIMDKPVNEKTTHSRAEDVVSLPTPKEYTRSFAEKSLISTLLSRKTCRSFKDRPVELRLLSIILYLSFGYLNERKNEDSFIPEGFGARRSSPSGGGLNACDIYVYVNNVKNLPRGCYAYHAAEHTLTLVAKIVQPLGHLLAGQHFINDIPFGVFLAGRLDKMWWKYEHSRAYRVSLFDIGHLSQTFQLVSTAAGLKTWLTAALSDRQIELVLGIVDYCTQPLLFVGAGYSDGATFSKELLSLMETFNDISYKQ